MRGVSQADAQPNFPLPDVLCGPTCHTLRYTYNQNSISVFLHPLMQISDASLIQQQNTHVLVSRRGTSWDQGMGILAKHRILQPLFKMGMDTQPTCCQLDLQALQFSTTSSQVTHDYVTARFQDLCRILGSACSPNATTDCSISYWKPENG